MDGFGLRWAAVLMLLCLFSGLKVIFGLPRVEEDENLRFPQLRFSKNRPFKMAIMSDLHYGEDAWTDWGHLQDVKSTNVQNFILDVEKPAIVIYLGDQVTSNNVAAANASAYWKEAVNPAAKRSLVFSTVFGDHDDSPMQFDDSWFGPSGSPLSTPDNARYYQRTTREQLLEVESEFPGSFTKAGPKSLWPSLSNHYITVSHYKDPNSIAFILYFLDSGGGTYQEVLSASQAAWFTDTAEKLNPNGSISEYVFFHIPTIQHSKVGPQPGGPITAPCVGSINYEAVAPRLQSGGVLDALTSRPSVKVFHSTESTTRVTSIFRFPDAKRTVNKATFSGHNHGLDWCCPYKTLQLCFARHTGYGGYGNWTRGSRILEFVESPEVTLKSWIRLENGSVVAETVL